MAKEPWQEDIYENQEEQTRTERRQRNQKGTGIVANRVLTILASLFFVIVVVMIIVLIYLSSESHSEEHTDSEGTITVQAGEGEATIAARAGISIAQLEALNPGHMATGSWFANPGDVIKIK